MGRHINRRAGGRRNGGGVARNKLAKKSPWAPMPNPIKASEVDAKVEELRFLLKHLPIDYVINVLSEVLSMDDLDELQARLP